MTQTAASPLLTAGRLRWLSALVGLLIIGGYLFHAWAFRAYINDDAYITFRYSLFLAEGRGPYFNDGEHVEGYTNFLLMLLMAAVIKVAGPDAAPAAAKVVGVAGGVLALLACWGLAARWLRRIPPLGRAAPLLAWFAPVLVALNSAFAVNSVSGLETTLFAGWITLGLWLFQRSADRGEGHLDSAVSASGERHPARVARWTAAGVAFGLGALTRPEGVMVAAVALGTWAVSGGWRTARRALVLDAAIVAVLVLGHSVFRWFFYDGELVPNTYYAKAGSFSGFIRAETYVWGYARHHLAGPVALACLLPWAGPPVLRRATAPALLTVILSTLALFHTGPDWMLGFRALVPYAPAWAALAVTGVAALVGAAQRRVVPLATAALALLLALVLWQPAAPSASTPAVGALAKPSANNAILGGHRWFLPIAREYAEVCRVGATGYAAGQAALGRWLREHARPGQTVALMDIGQVGYLCPALRILDITGLTDRHIAKAPGQFLRKVYDPRYVLEQKPAYLVLVMRDYRPPPDAGIEAVAFWPMDARIYEHPLFLRHYYKPRYAPAVEDKLARAAAVYGADRVFQHEDPRHVYLLAVYAYRE